KILDLCIAPSSYTASALKYNPIGKVIRITLPLDKGGYKVYLKSDWSTVLYYDIIIFAKEFSVDKVPNIYLEHNSFSLERPFIN
ncbi:hypothetical protein P154DRAFT_428146, partial [Amniculicola lignicola CBS 123094]